MALGEMPRARPLEQSSRLELGQDRGDAHRRLDVAALADVVDVVLVVDDEQDTDRRADAPARRRHGADGA